MEKQDKNMQKKEFGVGVDIKGNKCSRCHYEWVPHTFDDIPVTCPKCRSPYWNKEKTRFFKSKGVKKHGK